MIIIHEFLPCTILEYDYVAILDLAIGKLRLCEIYQPTGRSTFSTFVTHVIPKKQTSIIAPSK